MSRIASRHLLRTTSLLLVVCSFATTPIAAQRPDTVRIIAFERTQALADTFEARATRLAAKPDGWRDAASLQRRAAGLRGDDPRAVESWSRAAWLYAGAGKLGLARRMMEEAARHAAAGGDVERSASAYLDAALIAVEEGRVDLVPALLQRMRRVSESPLLTIESRRLLLARASSEPRLARYATP
jgi:hypothetical protein